MGYASMCIEGICKGMCIRIGGEQGGYKGISSLYMHILYIYVCIYTSSIFLSSALSLYTCIRISPYSLYIYAYVYRRGCV